MAFNSDTFNDLTQINRSRPSFFGKIWQKTALRGIFIGASLGFLAIQQPHWWQSNPPQLPNSTTNFSGKVKITVLNPIAGQRHGGSGVRDESVTAFIKGYISQGLALANLPEQLALKFQFHKVQLQQQASPDGYEVRLSVAHYEPIARIGGTPMLLSRAGAIYASNDPQHFNQLPSFTLPLATRWTSRRTLAVTREQQEHIDQAMELMAELSHHKIRYTQVRLKPHRGFQVVTDNGVFLQFGHDRFKASLSRYRKITKRDDFAMSAVKEIHLDFKGKALITMKPQAEQ